MTYFTIGLLVALGWSTGRFIWGVIMKLLDSIIRRNILSKYEEDEEKTKIRTNSNYKDTKIGFAKSEGES